jgi:hypothetical protein
MHFMYHPDRPLQNGKEEEQAKRRVKALSSDGREVCVEHDSPSTPLGISYTQLPINDYRSWHAI